MNIFLFTQFIVSIPANKTEATKMVRPQPRYDESQGKYRYRMENDGMNIHIPGHEFLSELITIVEHEHLAIECEFDA